MTSIASHHYPFEEQESSSSSSSSVNPQDTSNSVAPQSASWVLVSSAEDDNMPNIIMPSSAEQNNTFVVIVLIAMVTVLSLLFLYLLLPPLVAFCKQRLVPIFRRQERIKLRYETIEGWLISKRVRAHDEACECNQNRADDSCVLSASDNIKLSTSYDTADTSCSCSSLEEGVEEEEEEDLECPICVSPFLPDEIVSWSVPCNHVFHHECIKEWLLRFSTCPFCRQVYLPIDDNHVVKPINDHLFQQFVEQRRKRAMTTYFCETSGLVTMYCRDESNDHNDTTQGYSSSSNKTGSGGIQSDQQPHRQRAIISPCLKRTELAKLRGSRGALDRSLNSTTSNSSSGSHRRHRGLVVLLECGNDGDDDGDEEPSTTSESEELPAAIGQSGSGHVLLSSEQQSATARFQDEITMQQVQVARKEGASTLLKSSVCEEETDIETTAG